MEVLLIALLAGVPACIAYAGRGGRRFRSIVGTINLALAFLTAFAAETQMAADPPVKTAVATGLLSVVLAVTAVAIRPSDEGGTKPADGGLQDPRGTAEAGAPQPGQWAAPPHPGMPPVPGQGGGPGAPPAPGVPPRQQPWPPAG